MKNFVCSFLMIFIGQYSSKAQVDLKQGLVGCYSFSGNAEDNSGGNYHGRVNGAKLTTDRKGAINEAYAFDGQSYIEIPANQLKNNNYTFTLWAFPTVSPRSGETFRLFSIGGAGGDQNIDISNQYYGVTGWDAGGYDIPNSTVTGPSTGVIPELNKWYHLTVSREADNVKLYVNGKLASSQSTNGRLPFFGNISTRAIIGGRSTLTQFYTGKIDDIALYNRVLSPVEVEALYNQFPCETTPTIKLGAIPALVCLNDSLRIPFTTTGDFKADNRFVLQIAEGNSPNFVNIGSPSKTSPITVAVVPNLKPDVTYRVRVASTSPVIISDISSGFRIQPTAKATIWGDTIVEKGQKATLKVRFEGTPPWAVTLSDGQRFDNVSQTPLFIEVNPSQTTTYSILSLMSNDNCPKVIEGEAIVTVKTPPIVVVPTDKSIFVPDIFSPNRDGINDFFEVKSAFLTCQMTIFNRWGTAVFQTDDCQKGWDGKVKNEEAPIGSYVYKIEVENAEGTFVKRGTIILMR